MSTVVVTGGTRGLGLGLARALVQRGHQVVVCGTDPGAQRGAGAVAHPRQDRLALHHRPLHPPRRLHPLKP
jgi:NAD(P)-dependent dehydrogenase (short-subunit alcohol dehydrogenase family)